MIKLTNLTKFYNTKGTVAIGLQNINLEFNRGEFVAIVGPSGSGKTTLLNVISGMDTYDEGELELNGISTSNFSLTDFENYRRANVAFIFQNYQLIDSYTVLENVMVELILKGAKKKDAKMKAKEILKKVGLEKRMRNRATKLSGGEKQRCVIARALASDASILACDEPTGNLDSKNSQEIIKLLKEISSDKLVLMVTHDEELVQDIATRKIRIKDGMICEDVFLRDYKKQEFNIENPRPISLKTSFYIAVKNLLRTPKKSFFLVLIFTILSFIIIGSITSLSVDFDSSISSFIYQGNYNNALKDRMVVYPNSIDTSISGDNIIMNDFFLDIEFEQSIYMTNSFLDGMGYAYPRKDNLQIISGDFPDNKKEILLIRDVYLGQSYYDEVVGKKLILKVPYGDSTFGDGISEYIISGVASFIDNPVLSGYNDAFYLISDGFKELENIFSNKLIESGQSEYSIAFWYWFSQDIIFQSKNEKRNILIESSELEEDVYISSKYINKEYNLYIGNQKIDLSDFTVKYSPDINDEYSAIISSRGMSKIYEKYYGYRYSVFSNDIESEANNIKDNSSFVILKDLGKKSEFINIFMIVASVFIFSFLFMVLCISIFITTLIVSFVLATKKKNLGVLRVIGLSEKDVFKDLLIELEIVIIISISINYLIILMSNLFKWNINFSNYYKDPWKVLISILILFVIGFFAASKWNKKMFKKTAREVLKVGDNI